MPFAIRTARRGPPATTEWYILPAPGVKESPGAGEALVTECREYSSETDTADAMGTRGRLNLFSFSP